MVDPVARPSSIRRIVRSRTIAACRPPRNRRSRRSSSRRSRTTTCSTSAGGMRRSRIRSLLRTLTPPSAIAPMASSGCAGTPSLRTRKTSNGAASLAATSNATGTPPRGSPNTRTSERWAYSARRAASCRPASVRLLKRIARPLRGAGNHSRPAPTTPVSRRIGRPPAWRSPQSQQTACRPRLRACPR